ncbi:MAG: chorismate synthase, partial [candidate division NC10 bacterium]
MSQALRFLTAGESHGEALVAVIDGVPAGLPLAERDINEDLARRQPSARSSRPSS